MIAGCKHGHLPPCTQCGVEETIDRLTRELAAAKVTIEAAEKMRESVAICLSIESPTMLREALAEFDKAKQV